CRQLGGSAASATLPCIVNHHSTGTWESIPLSKVIGDHGKTDSSTGSAVHTEVGYDELVFTLGRPTCPRPIPGQVIRQAPRAFPATRRRIVVSTWTP